MKDTARAIAAALISKLAIDDPTFDRIYPPHVRRLSSQHWTPVEVALRAAEWLVPEPTSRVLDVGAGVGKVCCIGATARGGRWHGIERDPARVEIATAVAAALAVDQRVTFQAGEIDELDWRNFDSFYFYNPFAELVAGPVAPVRCLMFNEIIAITEQRLAELPPGTRVVTYQGFGGEMPDTYQLVAAEQIIDAPLKLWIKHQTRYHRSPGVSTAA